MNELQFLDGEIRTAQAALKHTAIRLGRDLKASASLPGWTREFPWPMVAASAAVGFLGGWAILAWPRMRRRARAKSRWGFQRARARARRPAKRPEPAAGKAKSASVLELVAKALPLVKMAATPFLAPASTNGKSPDH